MKKPTPYAKLGHKRLNPVATLREARKHTVTLRHAYAQVIDSGRRTLVQRFVDDIERKIAITQAAIDRTREVYGINIHLIDRHSDEIAWFWSIPSEWSDFEMTQKGKRINIFTGSAIHDVVYERGDVYLRSDTSIENIVHEVGHIMCACPRRLERVNYGTAWNSDSEYPSGFEAACLIHEDQACEAEVALLSTCDWAESNERIDILVGLDRNLESDTFQKAKEAWADLFEIDVADLPNFGN